MITTSSHPVKPQSPQASDKKYYLYTTLDDATIDGPEPLNFYGVIIDASYPHKTLQKYICSLKVVDHSCYIRDS